MLRRIATFLVLIALVAGVSLLVYFNAEETSFKLAPDYVFTLPLGVLMLAAAVAGAIVMFLTALLREGWHALHDWQVHRGIRQAQRTAEARAEARSLSLAGEYKRSRALFTKATKQRDPDAGDVIDYAGTYVLEGDLDEARRILEDGQKDFGNHPLLLYALARTCRSAGDNAAAISALERALAVYPASVRILTMLRDLLFESEQWQRGVEIQERVVTLRPEDPVERNWLLGARFESAMAGDESAREGALRSIVSSSPGFLPAVIHQARALNEAGDERRAFKVLEKAVRSRPRSAVLDEVELMSSSEDDGGKVTKLYAKLVSAQPEDLALRCRAASYMATHGKADEAAALLNEATDADEDSRAQAAWMQIHQARADNELGYAACRSALAHANGRVTGCGCETCGAVTGSWQERCDQCGSWGTIEAL